MKVVDVIKNWFGGSGKSSGTRSGEAIFERADHITEDANDRIARLRAEMRLEIWGDRHNQND